MTSRALVPFVLILGLAGCVGTLEPIDNGGGGGDDTGETPGAAEQSFTNNVAPLLNAACANCHAGAAGSTPLKFLGNAGTGGYYGVITLESAVVGDFDPLTAQLLLHGLHDGGNARAWTQAEKDTITAWMNAEATERGL